MRPTPYVASLRIYEPIEAFDPVDRVRWKQIPMNIHTGNDEQKLALSISIPHATLIHAIAVILLLFVTVAFYRAARTSAETKRLLSLFLALTLAQGIIGSIQYLQELPELLVALHLLGAVLVWIGAWKIWLSVQRQEMSAT